MLITKGFAVGDVVRIVNTLGHEDEGDLKHLIGKVGVVRKVYSDWDYPYNVEFLDVKSEWDNDWLWKPENLEHV